MKFGNGVSREPSTDAATYTYAGIGYATPDANGQISDGLFATTCTYTYTNDHGVPLVVIRLTTTNVVQTLDYFPFGGLRISVSTSTSEKRKYIDQFSDDSGLSYLNALTCKTDGHKASKRNDLEADGEDIDISSARGEYYPIEPSDHAVCTYYTQDSESSMTINVLKGLFKVL
jgi:hypothetical protein